jgi:uncharacterized membrane protein
LEIEKEAPKHPKHPIQEKVMVELWDISGDVKYERTWPAIQENTTGIYNINIIIIIINIIIIIIIIVITIIIIVITIIIIVITIIIIVITIIIIIMGNIKI